MTGKLRDALPLAGGEWVVSFITRDHPGALFDKLKGKEVTIDIKKAAKGRSTDANKFCWALCSEIGRAMNPPLAKEDVYRMAIKAVGVYVEKELPAFSINAVRDKWESHGDGWLFEVMDDAAPGRKLCFLYFGSSTYTVDEMRILLDWLTDQAEQMELQIPLSKEEEQRLLERWGKK